MKWCKTFAPGRPLRDVRLAAPTGTDSRQTNPDELREREQAAFERGLAEGEKRLSEQLLRQRSELIELQNGILASLRQSVAQVVRQSESALIQLALEVAQKLVSDLPINAKMIKAAVDSALAQAGDSTELHIFLHADDLALLKKSTAPSVFPGKDNQDIHLHPSADVTRGGCLVQTHFGIVDARRETKLELIRQSLES
jgi:flagellar assembly protein FliH